MSVIITRRVWQELLGRLDTPNLTSSLHFS